MAKKVLNPSTLLGPLPAVMVSCGTMEKSNILTVAWCGIINTSPAKTYISVRKSRYSYDLIKNSKEFVINLTSDALCRSADYCGMVTGRKIDKFEKCGLHKERASQVCVPLIAESPISLECKVTDVIELGTHDMFLADIVATDVNEELMEGDKLCIHRAHLCAFCHSEYYKLGARIGKFGFSVKKKRK